jgi:hypothetical protein
MHLAPLFWGGLVLQYAYSSVWVVIGYVFSWRGGVEREGGWEGEMEREREEKIALCSPERGLFGKPAAEESEALFLIPELCIYGIFANFPRLRDKISRGS